MSIGGVSLDFAVNAANYAQGTVMERVGTAVLSKAMDTQEVAGDGIQKMMDAAAMELSVNGNVGSNFDMRV